MSADPAAAALAEIAAGYFAGAVLMLGRPGEVLYHGACGHARVRPEAVAMGPDMVFDLASVTKAVATATAAGICVDAGLLDLAAPVCTYLPEFPSPEPTVAHLATHTSGLDNAKYDRLSGEAMLQAIATAAPVRPPGAVEEYSCLGYILLGLIIERVTGEALGDFCAQRIFGPLAMRDTQFGAPAELSRLAGSEREVAGEISDGQARQAGRPVGNAGVFSTAPDLARFAEMMLGGGAREGVRVLSAETVRRFTAPLTAPGLPPRGFAWDLRPVDFCPARGTRLSASAYGHTGWTGQSLWIDPERGLYAIVLTNRTHPRDIGNHETAAEARGRITDALVAMEG